MFQSKTQMHFSGIARPNKAINPTGITWIHLGLIVLATILVFSNTLENDYHLDSVYRIENNTEINQFWPPSRFFTDVRTGSTIPEIAEYRPMMPLSLSVNYHVARFLGISRLTGFHIGNILIHTATSILAYFLFVQFLLAGNRSDGPPFKGDTRQTAFVAALIFAIHPIAASAVNYLAARDLLLMVLFLFSSMLVYANMRNKQVNSLSRWLFSLILLSLAILSKQAAIMGFGFVFLFEWILKNLKPTNYRLWLRTAFYSIPTAGYFLLRWYLTSTEKASEGLRTPTDWTYPITMLDAHVFYYLRNFIWPFEMRALAEVEMLNSIFHPTALIGAVLIAGSLLLALYFRKRLPIISFCIFCYWLFLSLTSSIFPFQYVVTDYRQYLSSAFLSLAVTSTIFVLARKPLALTLSALLICYFAISSHFINTHWKTEKSFWGQSVKYGGDALAHHNYAMSVVREDPELAEKHYLLALEQHPNHIYANISLAMLEIRQSKVEAGISRLRRMVTLNPNWALSHYWLSVGLNMTGDRTAAVVSAKKAADLDPRSLRYQNHAAKMMQSMGQRKESIPYFERVVAINPNHEAAGFWLAFMYQKTGESDQSIKTYQNYIEHNPDHSQAHFNLAYELRHQGHCAEAIPHFETVLELRPSYSEAHFHLAKCFRSQGNAEKADFHLQQLKKKQQQ